MGNTELIFGTGVVTALGVAFLGGYVAHKFQEHLERENCRIRTNNVLAAVAMEIKAVALLYNEKIHEMFRAFPDGKPILIEIHEAVAGIEAYRQNVVTITSEINNRKLVSEIIEMDQLWRSLSAEFRINNRYLERLQACGNEIQRERVNELLVQHARTLRLAQSHLEKKAEILLREIDNYLLTSRRKPICWIRKT